MPPAARAQSGQSDADLFYLFPRPAGSRVTYLSRQFHPISSWSKFQAATPRRANTHAVGEKPWHLFIYPGNKIPNIV
jgi:hypothetical protein